MTVGTTLVFLVAFTLCGQAQESRPEVKQKPDRGTARPAEVKREPAQPKEVRAKPVRSSEAYRDPSEPKEVRSDEIPGSRQAQQTVGVSRGDDGQRRRTFQTVEQGLNSGKIGSLSELMGPQVHLDLRGAENGLYSSSQAYYLLEDYLRTRKLAGLEFTSVDEGGTMPYATGSAGLDHRGTREQAHVYVSLSRVGERWVISQLKIY
jgi:hypothetical protein